MLKTVLHFTFAFLLFFSSLLCIAQQAPAGLKKYQLSGKVLDKTSKQALEYATISLTNLRNPKMKTGGITNGKGEFDIPVLEGNYSIKIEFISFKSSEIKQMKLEGNTNLGPIYLEADASQLNEVVVKADKSGVEIKLDKKIYNVGQDLTTKGGTASDALGNVPSVSLDSDGNVSLRGNENVRILIDGRPTNSINTTDALKSIPADALDKIEVITNPSARYDAEGGAGIINIVLKKGKSKGVNGSIISTIGSPQNYGLTSTLNYKTENFNLFSTLGYTDNKATSKGIVNSDYLNPDGSIQKSIDERSNRERARKGYNYTVGMDLYLDKTLTWSNAITYRKNEGLSPDNVLLFNYETNNNFVRNRINNQMTKTNDFEYTTNFTKKFKKEGHKLTVDATVTQNRDDDASTITDFIRTQENNVTQQATNNNQNQSRRLIQTDYILPLGKNAQFEAGYKGDFNELMTDYNVGSLAADGSITNNVNLTNKLQYKEHINALYTQFGSKINKFSYLFGMRYENSDININLLTTNDFNTKKYYNFFPSAFLTYQISDASSLSLNYSRRVMRPRSRFINPFVNYSSNVNLFQGNPDLNPAFTDAFDLGYMTKWDKITFSTSAYINETKDVFQFVKRPTGDVVSSVVNGQTVETTVLVAMPINLAKENRFGFECNINYTPFKKWRLNANFNFYESKISGAYSYKLLNSNETVNEIFDRTALGWFSRVSSKVSLPFKIEWQTNAMYRSAQNTTQGRSLGVLSANLAFSKDVLKTKGTIALNVNDVFNSDKFKINTFLPTVNSYVEMQRRPRQINLSFTYRFNKQKNDMEKQPKKMQGEGDMDYQG